MVKVRKGTFETNSSSTHSITICTASDYKKFQDGELYYNTEEDEFFTREQALDFILKNERDNEEVIDTIKKIRSQADSYYIYENYTIDDFLTYYNIYSFEAWQDRFCEYYETYLKFYVTEGGEGLAVFGYYGHD